jgi:hypothetical protein
MWKAERLKNEVLANSGANGTTRVWAPLAARHLMGEFHVRDVRANAF